MKIFWYNLPSIKGLLGLEGKSAFYSTNFTSFDGSVTDGVKIARNNTTFYKMYRVNVDIRSAIREKKETAMKSGYEVRQLIESTQKEKLISDVPHFKAAMKKSGGIRKLKNKICSHLDIFGNVYLHRTFNVRGVMKYTAWDPRYVTIFSDSDLNVTKYLYRNPAQKGREIVADAEAVIHVVNDEDLDNPIFGISPLETIVVDVLGDEEAARSNLAFFSNDGIPSALYVMKEGIQEPQASQVIQQVKDSLKGGTNQHKSITSNAIQDVKVISQQHTDANFTSQRNKATEKVCAALGVPRTQLGYVEGVNHSNGDAQYEQFIENTIRPLEEVLEEVFTTMLHDFVEYEKYTFHVIDEHIDTIGQKSDLANKNVTGGIWTRNEARLYVGNEASKNEFADELTVNANTRLLDDLANGTDPVKENTDPTNGKGEEEEDEKDD